jgi:alkylation response protein AidB-like acyl-CoA dehydrogenase
MVTEMVGARLITYQTAWRLGRGLATETDIALAKSKANKAYRLVTFEGHEVHGAIGWSVEYDLQLYFRRRLVDEVAFGDYDEHIHTIADAVVAGTLPQSHYN